MTRNILRGSTVDRPTISSRLSTCHARSVLATKNTADQPGDLGWRQTSRGDLVEQRLEGVMIAPVGDRDIDGRAGQHAGRPTGRRIRRRRPQTESHGRYCRCHAIRGRVRL